VAPYLRRDEDLPDDAIVVKGGLISNPEKLRGDALDCYAKLEVRGEEPVHGVSVCSLPDCTADEIARAVGTFRLPQTQMRVSTVGQLELYGYLVVPSGQYGHATLIFPGSPTEGDWENLQQIFDDPVDNPVARGKQ
jgi:hypothetical protein